MIDLDGIRRELVTYRQIMAESDVPYRAADEYAHRLAVHVPTLLGEVDRLQTALGQTTDAVLAEGTERTATEMERDAARAEVERMRPVVEAAYALLAAGGYGYAAVEICREFEAAVRTYEATSAGSTP